MCKRIFIIKSSMNTVSYNFVFYDSMRWQWSPGAKTQCCRHSIQLNCSMLVLLGERSVSCVRSRTMHIHHGHGQHCVTASSYGKRIKYTDQTMPSESLHIYMHLQVEHWAPMLRTLLEGYSVSCSIVDWQIISPNFQIVMGCVCVHRGMCKYE